MGYKVNKDELKKRLTAEQYKVTQEQGTERAFSGQYHDSKAEGVYRCIVCDEPLFESGAKFNSRTGWPSFFKPIKEDAVESETDRSHFMVREEVHCKNCGAHLGHIFDDAPQTPTGLRYCINSASLNLDEKK